MIDAGTVFTGRGTGGHSEPPGITHNHTRPLERVAEALGYESTDAMHVDNKATIPFLALGSGAKGAPGLTTDASIVALVAYDEYPFTMNAEDTIFMAPGVPSVVGAYILVVSFAASEPDDKVVSITATDNVTDTALNPARPWTFSSIDVPVMKGYSTAQYVRPNEYTP